MLPNLLERFRSRVNVRLELKFLFCFRVLVSSSLLLIGILICGTTYEMLNPDVHKTQVSFYKGDTGMWIKILWEKGLF